MQEEFRESGNPVLVQECIIIDASTDPVIWFMTFRALSGLIAVQG